MRGTGVGLRALQLVLGLYTGRWHLRAIHDNARAIRFWRKSLRASSVRELEVHTENADITFRFTT